jgi:hypothetical protein
VTLDRPAAAAGEEPEEAVVARIRIRPRADAATRPRLDLTFVLDASASMHHFVLDPDQRAYWRNRAEQRGELSRSQVDGRTGTVWTGQTLRELQHHVSTPMLSTLRGVWRTLESLDPGDRPSVLAFADHHGVLYEDPGAEKAERLATAKTALARLGSGVDQSGLGRGTRLAGALGHALERMGANPDEPGLRRMVLVSDGIIEDETACRPLLDAAVDRGLVISVIGVGEEFDEEFLMRIADLSRGNYYYAATAREVEAAVLEELALLGRVVGRRGVLRVLPESGAIIQDVYPIAPALSEFQTVWVEGGGWRYRIGDLSPDQPLSFLVRIAPPAFAAGQARLATIRVEAVEAMGSETYAVEAAVPLLYTEEAVLLRARDEEVAEAAERLEIYLSERRAANALAQGDTMSATRNLQSATRSLRARGEDALADDMEAVAAEALSGTRSLGRTKRMKAGTRRLGQGTRVVKEEEENLSPDTRQLP